MIVEEVLDVVRCLLPIALSLPVDLRRVHADQPNAVYVTGDHWAVISPADWQVRSDVDCVSVHDMRDSANNTAQARAKRRDEQQRHEQRNDQDSAVHVATCLGNCGTGR